MTYANVSRDLPWGTPTNREKIRQAGQRILQEYCSNETGEPIMIPPIPDSKFVDKLPENERFLRVDRNVVDRGHHDGYEAEVKLYRSFEELRMANLLVIHQLEYTHGQYLAFLPDHLCETKNCVGRIVDSPKDSELGSKSPKKLPVPQKDHRCHNQIFNKEGECDFVVVGIDFVAVFEVKAFSLKKLEHRDEAGKQERFKVCCDGAIKQRNKIIDLIKSIDSSVMVFGFTVLNNMSIDDFTSMGLRIDRRDLLLSDDFTNFAKWFDENIHALKNQSVDNQVVIVEKIKCYLLGLWCMNNKNFFAENKCNFAQCIKNVDNFLKKAIITGRSIREDEAKRKSPSPLLGRSKRKKTRTSSGSDTDNDEIHYSSDIFKRYLNIQCLSRGQQEIFDCNERFLWVNGPAGSGKTVVMLAKILQIILEQHSIKQNSTKKVILICPDLIDCSAVKRHQRFLDTIKGAPYEIIAVDTDIDKLISQITRSTHRVMLLKSRLTESGSFIMLLKNLIKLLRGSYHIIVDDFQLDKFWTDSSDQPEAITGFIRAMGNAKECSNADISVWIFCDLAQQILYETLYQANHIEKLNENHRSELKSSFKTKSLEVNLRNTCDISQLLAFIRSKFTAMVQSPLANHEVGHFVRGTKPVFYLIDELTYNLTGIITKILQQEMNRLDGLGDNDIGILYNDRSNLDRKFLTHPQNTTVESNSATWRNAIQEISTASDKTVDVERIEDSWSAEWPAVVAVIRGPVLWTELYLAVSRARVHCSVIIVESGSESDAAVFLKEMELKHGVCKVINVSDKLEC